MQDIYLLTIGGRANEIDVTKKRSKNSSVVVTQLLGAFPFASKNDKTE